MFRFEFAHLYFVQCSTPHCCINAIYIAFFLNCLYISNNEGKFYLYKIKKILQFLLYIRNNIIIYRIICNKDTIKMNKIFLYTLKKHNNNLLVINTNILIKNFAFLKVKRQIKNRLISDGSEHIYFLIKWKRFYNWADL